MEQPVKTRVLRLTPKGDDGIISERSTVTTKILWTVFGVCFVREFYNVTSRMSTALFEDETTKCDRTATRFSKSA